MRPQMGPGMKRFATWLFKLTHAGELAAINSGITENRHIMNDEAKGLYARRQAVGYVQASLLVLAILGLRH